MPQQYCLHQLSAQGQHPSLKDAQDAILCMIRRLEKLSPLIRHKLVQVFYDRSVEARSLETSRRNFLGLINTLPKDIKSRWFIAVKNYATSISVQGLEVSVQDLPNRAARIEGVAPEEFLSKARAWLSFIGTTVFDCAQVEVSHGEGPQRVVVTNHADEASLTRHWPVYEASPKHRLEEYQRNGLRVSAMDLTAADAQGALLVSVEVGGSRYSTLRGKVYRFVPTNSGQIPETFHGFRIAIEDLSDDILKALRATILRQGG